MMEGVYVRGVGAVSPAGWGVAPLMQRVTTGEPVPFRELTRPGTEKTLRARSVPPANPKQSWLAHPRLRRTSPITQYIVAAGLEALGEDAAKVTRGELRLGIVVAVMSGCVNYSRRFYDEVLRDPATASPLVFPETVFNAPSSHLAALLSTNAINYTLVGDPGTFLQALALGADWLAQDMVDGCLVIGAEEVDWLTSQAFQLFHRKIVLSDGAGAIYLRGQKDDSVVQLGAVTDAHLFTPNQSRSKAAQNVREQMASLNSQMLVDGVQDLPRYDAAELAAWSDWKGTRVSPKRELGEGLMAAAAWQCVVAINSVRERRGSAVVSVVGTNQQAIGAEFRAA